MPKSLPSPRTLALAIGTKVRKHRLRPAQRRTQSRVARSAGISISFLSMIERGERLPTLDTLYRLARALGIRPSDLLL